MHICKVIMHCCEFKMCLLRSAGMRRRFVNPCCLTFRMCLLTYKKAHFTTLLFFVKKHNNNEISTFCDFPK